MKCLVFSPYYPPHKGGLETHAQQWNRHMAQTGMYIMVVTSHLPRTSPQEEKDGQHIHLLRLPAFEIIRGYPLPNIAHPLYWQMVRKIIFYRPKIVVTRTRFFLWSLLGGLYARIRTIPWVHIEHGSDYVHFRSRFLTFLAYVYDRTLGSLTLRLASYIVANSKASALFVKKLHPLAHPEVIYRGVEKEKIKQIAPNQTVAVNFHNKKIITFAGRLMPGKGVDVILQALARIDHASLVCFIIGDGPDASFLQDYVKRNNLEKTVVFMGEKSQADVIALLKVTDIFVHASFTEGLPSVVIEAALCGCAIITTDVGGTTEIITKDNAFIIPPHDIEALEQALIKMLAEDDVRQTWGQKAFQHVKTAFNWDYAVEAYQRVFKKLVS